MSARRIVGLTLVAIGMVILLWGGIFWRDRDTVVDAGPLKVETSERKGIALPPVLGAATLITGIILMLMPVVSTSRSAPIASRCAGSRSICCSRPAEVSA